MVAYANGVADCFRIAHNTLCSFRCVVLMAQMAAMLYANRAAVGLKLERYEQVVHDANCAVALVTTKGCSDSGEAPCPVLLQPRGARQGQAFSAASYLALVRLERAWASPRTQRAAALALLCRCAHGA